MQTKEAESGKSTIIEFYAFSDLIFVCSNTSLDKFCLTVLSLWFGWSKNGLRKHYFLSQIPKKRLFITVPQWETRKGKLQ